MPEEPERDPVTDAEPPAPPTDAQEAEIEEAAQVTDDDLDAAVDAWKRHAPRAYRDLLDAE